ncbi:MAG: hypothetical protein ACXABY_11765 [Candidatus Thorarchaeota archaeon]|jgi:hypothetical protein
MDKTHPSTIALTILGAAIALTIVILLLLSARGNIIYAPDYVEDIKCSRHNIQVLIKKRDGSTDWISTSHGCIFLSGPQEE